MTSQVLDLTIEEIAPDRPLVKMPDGNQYEMRLPQEFGIEENVRAGRVSAQMQRIMNGEEEDLSDDDAASLNRSVRRFLAMLLPDVPEDVLDQLEDRHRVRLMNHFASFARAATEEEETPSDTPPKSQSSNGTTAATRKRG